MNRPIRILELRSVRGTGGGPEKTILQGAVRGDPSRFETSVCYIRDLRDPVFSIDEKAAALAVDYVDVRERHSFDPAIWPALRHVVRDRRIDIVHAHDYKTNLLAYLLAKAEPIVPLSTVHGWTGNSWRERALYYPLDQRLLARFPRLIAVSGEIKTVLVRRGADPARVCVVLNGIDHFRYRRDRSQETSIRRELGLGPGQTVIGSVGRVESQKRFDILIDAVATVLPNRPDLRLVIAGDGSVRSQIAAHAAARLPADSCLLLGNRDDVARLHHAFDVYVQSSDYEGTPNAVLEAMALETPVVATDVGGTRELMTDGVHGIIVPPASASALAAAIERSLADREAATRRASAARKRIEEELSFERRMQRVEAIYEEILAVRRPRNAAKALTSPL
jgi:glycosyltransferase involved in cell wall biosynthesis